MHGTIITKALHKSFTLEELNALIIVTTYCEHITHAALTVFDLPPEMHEALQQYNRTVVII